MDPTTVPDDYEERLAACRSAAERLPPGPAREDALGALDNAPTKAEAELAAVRGARGTIMADELQQANFEGSDPYKFAWVRLDYTGWLRGLYLDSAVDRLSGEAVAEAILAAWKAAEGARDEAAGRSARLAAELSASPDPKGEQIRRCLAETADRFAAESPEETCRAEVDLAGRLVGLRFLASDATFAADGETLAAETASTIQAAQQRAISRRTSLVSSLLE